MSGPGKHLWSPSMAERTESHAEAKLRIAKRGKVTNGCLLERNDAQDAGRVRFFHSSLSLVSSSNLGACTVCCFLVDRISRIRLGTLVVVWTPSTAVLGGIQIRVSVSFVQVRLALAAVLKTAPSSRGEDPEDFDGCSFVNAAVKEDGPIFAVVAVPFVCELIPICSVSIGWAEIFNAVLLFFGQVQATSS